MRDASIDGPMHQSLGRLIAPAPPLKSSKCRFKLGGGDILQRSDSRQEKVGPAAHPHKRCRTRNVKVRRPALYRDALAPEKWLIGSVPA